MMKKLPALVVMALVLAMTFCLFLTACNNEAEPAEGDQPVSPTDIVAPESEKPPMATPIEGEPLIAEVEEAVSELEQQLDITIELPEDFVITRSVMVKETQAQIEFTMDDEAYTGRYAQGLQDNMSGMSKGFAHEETVEIAGVQVKIRWTSAEDTMSEVEPTIGVADAYDQDKNLSYMVVLTKNSTKEKMAAAMEAFMQAATLGAPSDDPEDVKTVDK